MARVLCVDDSAVARAATSRRLAEFGLEVTALGSSREGRAAESKAFAAALLDIDLGDGLGIDVAEALRAARPDLPIAFLTADAEPDAASRAANIGPVFSKASEIEEAVRWVAAHALATEDG